MTTERQPIPVLSAHPFPERTERAPLLSPSAARGVAGFIVALGAFVLLVGLLVFAGGEGINAWGLVFLAGGAGAVALGRWLLGGAGREEWGL